jgi:hypothetical protein
MRVFRCSEETMEDGDEKCSSEEEIDEWTSTKNILIKMLDKKMLYDDYDSKINVR